VSSEILWDLTVADYREWRKAFYAAEGNEEIELNLLNAILRASDRLTWRVVWTYLDLIECRPPEKVDPFFKKREAK